MVSETEARISKMDIMILVGHPSDLSNFPSKVTTIMCLNIDC